jgi:3-hydroxyisobutyrate dehydrogenase-like beta-hydroxyacid dehydrogenase
MRMKVGFIGLGSMGRPMAERIQSQGHELTVWARREATLEPFADIATVVSSPAEMGKVVDVVGVCVFDAKGVDEVVFGPDGLVETLKPGSVILMHSTVAPLEVQQLADKATERGLRLLDAPVSGGQPQALIGRLTIMVGGEASTIEAVSEVLAAMSDHVVHLGGIGAGSRAKLVNNTMFSAQIQLADYAMIAGQSLGIDPDGLADVLLRSSSACVASGLRMRAGSMAGVTATQADLPLSKDVKLMHGLLGDAPGHELVDIASEFVTTMKAVRAAAESS